MYLGAERAVFRILQSLWRGTFQLEPLLSNCSMLDRNSFPFTPPKYMCNKWHYRTYLTLLKTKDFTVTFKIF